MNVIVKKYYEQFQANETLVPGGLTTGLYQTLRKEFMSILYKLFQKTEQEQFHFMRLMRY
jgi:hypothetical protein